MWLHAPWSPNCRKIWAQARLVTYTIPFSVAGYCFRFLSCSKDIGFVEFDSISIWWPPRNPADFTKPIPFGIKWKEPVNEYVWLDFCKLIWLEILTWKKKNSKFESKSSFKRYLLQLTDSYLPLFFRYSLKCINSLYDSIIICAIAQRYKKTIHKSCRTSLFF